MVFNRNGKFINTQIINNVLHLYVKGLGYTRITEIMNERIGKNYYTIYDIIELINENVPSSGSPFKH